MKLRAFILIPTLLTLPTCASHSLSSEPAGGYPPWPEGDFDLRATVSYRMDTESSTRTERKEITAWLHIAPDGSMELQSSSGLCHTRNEDELESDRVRGVRTFPCQEAAFVLRSLGENVGGEVMVSVAEGLRTRGPCMRYTQTASGDQVCAEYRWEVNLRDTSKRASLRVVPRS
jgi:hypothetical protein